MSMKSKDLIKQEKLVLAQNMAAAIKTGDEGQMALAFAEFNAKVQESIIAESQELAVAESRDATVLAGRGVRQLTNEETKYYNALGKAMASPDPKAALTNIEVAMPKTVIEAVIDDIRTGHRLLEKINFRNTYGAVKMILNAQGAQTAKWGKLTSAIVEELSGSFKEVDATASKLTSYMPVSKDLLALGPQWLDSYVREVLSEALAAGLEEAIVTGTGKDMFTGMDRDMSATAAVTNGERPKMTPVAIIDLSPVTLGGLCAKLARHPLYPDKGRPVTDVILLTNPMDYWEKVMPATTILKPDGGYAKDVLPIEAEIIQTAALEKGVAIIGIASKYFAGMGIPKDGRVEFDDSVRFLQDERVYTIKTIGVGMPMDEYAFILLNISGLQPKNLEVVVKEVKGVVNTKAQA